MLERMKIEKKTELRVKRSPSVVPEKLPSPTPRAGRGVPSTKGQGSQTIGPILRRVRELQGLTLAEMGKRTGIPVSTLSKVERDLLTLTYDKIYDICQKLGMRMSEFFSEPANPVKNIGGRRSIGTLENAIHVSVGKYEYYYLCPDLRRKRIVPIYIRVKAKTLEEFGEFHYHVGEEWIYVVEGAVDVHTELYEAIRLEVGQALYLDSTMGHAFLAAEGYEEASIICSCWSSEEDA
jgi:transcriptional regulator with XRE-family HTH domain